MQILLQPVSHDTARTPPTQTEPPRAFPVTIRSAASASSDAIMDLLSRNVAGALQGIAGAEALTREALRFPTTAAAAREALNGQGLLRDARDQLVGADVDGGPPVLAGALETLQAACRHLWRAAALAGP